MTYSFFLKDPQGRIPVSGQKKTPIVLIVSSGGRKCKKQIGLSVFPSEFKKQRTKREAENAYLRTIERCLDERLGGPTTEQQIKDAIEYAIASAKGRPVQQKEKKGVGASRPSFWEYFGQWAERDVAQKRQRKNIRRLICETMGSSDDWESIDSAYHLRMVTRMKEDGRGLNYIASAVSMLKTVMGEGYRLKFHTNTDFQAFKRHEVQPDTVYLTRAEVDAIYGMQFQGALKSKVRDLFILGCSTAMRFSDYSRLSLDNIRDGFIYLTQKKTGGRVVIPASPRVLEILNRWGGKAPAMSQQVFNRRIKEVAKEAGIVQPVEVTRTRGDKRETSMLPKYTQVSSHTARRTAATLMYQSGIPASQVMAITGHSTESAFYHYIRTTKEENARMLASNPYFMI